MTGVQYDLFGELADAEVTRADEQAHAAERLRESQERARVRREAFHAALDVGPAPAPWFAVPCPVCQEAMRLGDLVVKNPNPKRQRNGLLSELVVHEGCAA